MCRCSTSAGTSVDAPLAHSLPIRWMATRIRQHTRKSRSSYSRTGRCVGRHPTSLPIVVETNRSMLKTLRAYWFWILLPVVIVVVLIIVALSSDDSSAFTYPV